MSNAVSRLFLLLTIVCWAGSGLAFSVEPTSLPFSYHGGSGTFEFVGSDEDGTRLDFRVHVTSGRLDEIRISIGTDPFYIPSTMPGPDVDVYAVAGDVVMFFQMVDGLHSGESSDIFSATFPNGLTADALGEATFRRLDSVTSDTLLFTVVPEPSTTLLLGSGLVGLAAGRRRTRGSSPRPSYSA